MIIEEDVDELEEPPVVSSRSKSKKSSRARKERVVDSSKESPDLLSLMHTLTGLNSYRSILLVHPYLLSSLHPILQKSLLLLLSTVFQLQE